MARLAGVGAALDTLPLSAVQQVQLCAGLTLVALVLIHRLGTVHLVLSAVVIGVTGQASGLPGA